MTMATNIYRAWWSRFLAIVYGCQSRQVERRNVRGTESQEPYDRRRTHFQMAYNKRSERRRRQLRNNRECRPQCVDAMEFLWKRNVVRKKIDNVGCCYHTHCVGRRHVERNTYGTAARRIYVSICTKRACVLRPETNGRIRWPWHFVGGQNAKSIIVRIARRNTRIIVIIVVYKTNNNIKNVCRLDTGTRYIQAY